jgi:hypothetical protein
MRGGEEEGAGRGIISAGMIGGGDSEVLVWIKH